MDYISNTPQERKNMLEEIGVEEVEELFTAVPEKVRFNKEFDLPAGISELELLNLVKEKAEKNSTIAENTSFLGAGAYDHFIPSIVDHMISRSEFYTAYTPYQAELSQGTLEAIYEYQSMIAELTGMDIANASMLDGGSALAEAVLMASRITRKENILISKGVHPSYREVTKTYTEPKSIKLKNIELKKAKTPLKNIKDNLDENTAAVVIQYPNFYGTIEDLKEIGELLKDKKTLFIVAANPITLGMLEAPGNLGADIVVGEGQSLGNTINYGGPYLGYMAIRNDRKHLRQLPGRLAGATEDKEGNKGFVLTLQTREQHIRREKAPSNICSNESLNALISAIYMSAMGKKGIKEVGYQSTQKAHYFADKINNLDGFEVVNKDNFFHEFWIKTPLKVSKIKEELSEEGILAGVDLNRFNEEEGLLICVTEKRTKEEIDEYLKKLEVLADERTSH
ncbi:MAG: aminomethyl-transferring glycine dehydrogenase subunit GcvPA [Bacillota bacterium]